MAIELKVPAAGESISVVEVGRWLKQQGEFVKRDEVVAEIETEKATVEVSAPADGVLTEIRTPSGQEAKPGDVLALLDTEARPVPLSPAGERADVSGANDGVRGPRVMPSAPNAFSTNMA